MEISKIILLALLLAPVYAHSWIEELRLIDADGRFFGEAGYMRDFVARSEPTFADTKVTHLLPPNDPHEIQDDHSTTGISPQDFMCRKSQQSQTPGARYPRLRASPGEFVALRYAENGHVTLPENSKGKPANRGTVYVYGTSSPHHNEAFLDVFDKWTLDGNGGDRRGRLLAAQPYDDGRCYQVNDGVISRQRQKDHPLSAMPDLTSDLLCQNDIQIPPDIPVNQTFTLYWVWDWPTAPNVDSALPKGKTEVYTSCIDVDIVATTPRPPRCESSGVRNMAISSYLRPSATATSTLVATKPERNLAQAESMVLSILGERFLAQLASPAAVSDHLSLTLTNLIEPRTSS